ncbi:MAG: glycosyltransferase family 2 protein [Candidatus Omnitrophica bacterium]|nr:glycosyltransferase family 2 protein [Candidatus Omnitrophota bacterium]
MERIPLSLVVITKNEQDNIEKCLESAYGWADEIVVVDDHSSDRTVELAEKYADKILHRRMDNEGRHRNWAYDQAKHDWVFSLDADERVTPELKEEITRTLAGTACNAFTIPRRNIIGQTWLKHGGQYPSAQLRLFSRSRSKFHYEEAEVHPLAFFEKPEGRLKSDILHYSYRDFEHFLAKINGQTTLEAQKWVRDGRKMSLGKALWRFLDRFMRAFFRKKGHKDGFYGFMSAFFSALYQIVSYAKYWERKTGNIVTDSGWQPDSGSGPEADDRPRAPVTVVILAKNEQANIEACLKSVCGWADEIIVIDDESADNTAKLASRYADRVIVKKMENEGRHRNWAYAQARNEWVFSLDADEVLTHGLRQEVREAIAKEDNESLSVPMKTFIGRHWVRYGGWYPANKMRIFMKSKQWYEEVEVHPRVANCVTCGVLTKDLIHKGYPDFEHFLASLNRQTTLEARKWIQTGRHMSFGKAAWRTIDRFPRIFFGKRGYKDGFIGFMVAFFASLYQIVSYAKYWQMKKESVKP